MIQAFRMLDQVQETLEKHDTENKGCQSYIIKPNSRTKLYWDAFTNIFFMISYFVTPFNLAVGQPLPEQKDL